ncbi:MAG: aspartate--ammonia ligase [Oligoflexia bacterium]|nr:aspartate--ammonia ligase [Oligoflexia bacterium]
MSAVALLKKQQKPSEILRQEGATFFTKSTFEKELSKALDLCKISAPLFVESNSGFQDDLNGIEKPISFKGKAIGEGQIYEIVHSLAKWKRFALAQYEVAVGKGIVTDMRALRPDEEGLDSLHSMYVDQWDWEKVITASERTLVGLRATVEKIYSALKATEQALVQSYPEYHAFLPETIHFIHSEELLQLYPSLSRKEREDSICKRYGAVFLIGIGGELPDGTIHDGRAPDYDDWSTPTEAGKLGLNGDIIIWNPILERSFEISSMGIRVDKEALLRQLAIRGVDKRQELPWHQLLLQDKLPLTMGGGIGQSRVAMLLMQKAHIGEVQISAWPPSEHEECSRKGIYLLK